MESLGGTLVEKGSGESQLASANDHLISFLAEVSVPLNTAMKAFIECHPNWDQYRLIQAALAGFLVQNGVKSRAVNRLYVDSMFSKSSFGRSQ